MEKEAPKKDLKKAGHEVTINSPHNFWDFEDSKKDDYEYVKGRVSINGSLLNKASPALKNNEEIVKIAIDQKWNSLNFASEEIRHNESVCLLAIEKDAYAIHFVGGKLLIQRKFTKKAVSTNGLVLEYCSEEYRNDGEIVMSAVRQNGLSIQYATFLLREEKKIAKTSVSQNGLSLRFLSPRLRNDEDIVKSAVCQNGYAFEFASRETLLQNNSEILILAIKQNPFVFESLDEELKNNRDLSLEVVKEEPIMLEYLLEKFRDDFQIVKSAVSSNGLVLEHSSARLSNDKIIAIFAVRNNGWALQFVSRKEEKEEEAFFVPLRDDEDVFLKAIENNPFSFKFGGSEVKKKNKFIWMAIEKMSRIIEISVSKMNRSSSSSLYEEEEEETEGEILDKVDLSEFDQIDMFYERGCVYLYHAMEFRLAFEDFIIAFINFHHREQQNIFILYQNQNDSNNNNKNSDRKNRQMLIKDEEFVDLIVNKMSLSAQNVMIQQAQEDWVYKWTRKRSLFDRHLSERELEQERKIICVEFVKNVLGRSLRRIQTQSSKIKSSSISKSSSSNMNRKKKRRKKKKGDSSVQKGDDSVEEEGQSVMMTRYKEKVLPALTKGCQASLIAWYGEKKKVAYLGILGAAAQVPEGFGFEFIIIPKSKAIVIRSNTYYRRFYGYFDRDGHRSGMGKEYVKNILVFEGFYKKNLRDGKGKEYSTRYLTHSNYASSPTSPKMKSVNFPDPSSSKKKKRQSLSILSSSTNNSSSTTGLVTYEGQFSNDVKHGEGEKYDESRQMYVRGYWEEGKLIKVHSSYQCPIIPFHKIEKYLRHEMICGRGAFGLIYMIESSKITDEFLTLLLQDDYVHPTQQNHEVNNSNDQSSSSSEQSNKSKKIIKKSVKMKKKKRKKIDEYIAVKIFETGNSAIRREYMFRNIKSAIELCGNVKDKEHILDVKGIVKGEQIGYIMECCMFSVDKIVSSSPSIEEKVRIIFETAKGMRSLHSHNIMHRDLKWSNCLLTRERKVKITDFDSCKEDPTEWKLDIQPHTQSEVGTAEFQAPEIFDSGNYDKSVDVYSFGIMIYSMLFGLNNPFSSLYQCQTCGTPMENIMKNPFNKNRSNNPLILCTHISRCGLRPLIDHSKIQMIEKEYRYLISLAVLCWQSDPKKRPNFNDIVEVIETEMKRKKCYSIVQICLFVMADDDSSSSNSRSNQETKKRKKKKSRNSSLLRPTKVLLMKPSIQRLKEIINKKINLSHTSTSTSSTTYQIVEIHHQRSKRSSNRKKKLLRSDEDVIEMVRSEENPTVLVYLKSKMNKQTKKIKNDDESMVMIDTRNEEEMKSLDDKDSQILPEKMMREELFYKKKYEQLRVKLEDTLNEWKRKKKEKKGEISSEDSEIMFQQLQSLLE